MTARLLRVVGAVDLLVALVAGSLIAAVVLADFGVAAMSFARRRPSPGKGNTELVTS